MMRCSTPCQPYHNVSPFTLCSFLRKTRCWIQKSEVGDTDTKAVCTHWVDTLFRWKIKNSQQISHMTGFPSSQGTRESASLGQHKNKTSPVRAAIIGSCNIVMKWYLCFRPDIHVHAIPYTMQYHIPISIPYTLVSYLKSINMLFEHSSLFPFLCICVCVCLLPFCCSLTYHFSHYYSACASMIGMCPSGSGCRLCKFIVVLHVLLAESKISILLLQREQNS